MFQRARRDREPQRFGRCSAFNRSEDEPCSEAVASADAVHEVNGVAGPLVEFPGRAVVEQRAPAVLRRRRARAQRHRHLLDPEFGDDRFAGCAICRRLDASPRHVGACDRDAERGLEVFFVRDEQVGAAHEGPHGAPRVLLVPKLAAVVEVDAPRDARRARRGERAARALEGSLAKRRRDAGRVKPRRVGEDLGPGDGRRIDLAQCGVSAVVDDDRRALARAGFREVDAHAMAAALDVTHVDSFAAQGAHAGFADSVAREPRDEAAVQAEVGEADRDVRLASAEGGLQRGRLEHAFETGCVEPQEQLAECDGLLRDHRSDLRSGSFVRASRMIVVSRRACSVMRP